MKNIAINPEDYTILAVDDIATNIMLLKAVLSRAKYKIVTASGGNEALEKAATELPDLILLDIMMPDMDGYEVIKHLKADPALQDIPVIFLTALHNPEDIVKGFKLGASDYVSKPFNHEELITRVSHHIYLAAAQRTIMQQRDELQATVDARDKMYSVIAHDLRSPIGTLKMVFNMLSINLTQQQIGEDNMEMITMGNNITESTFMLLDNLLKWTKSQIGRMNTVFQEVDISEVVVFASKMSDLVAQVKNIAVEYDSDKWHTGSSRIANDARRRNIFVHLGITEICVTKREFNDLIAFDKTARILSRRLRHRVHPRSEEFDSRQMKLRKKLLAPLLPVQK